jgi:hypothetical protein
MFASDNHRLPILLKDRPERVSDFTHRAVTFYLLQLIRGSAGGYFTGKQSRSLANWSGPE